MNEWCRWGTTGRSVRYQRFQREEAEGKVLSRSKLRAEFARLKRELDELKKKIER